MRALLLLSAALALCSCKREGGAASSLDAGVNTAALEKPACTPKVLIAQKGTPVIDGELDEPVWHAAQATQPFVHEHKNHTVPHAEARAAYDEAALYLAFYVGDAELTSSDQVAVSFEGKGRIEATVAGVLRCDLSGQTDCAKAGVVAKLDRDGDVDADKEEDEEYAVELKIPWTALGETKVPSKLPLNFSRVETLDGEKFNEVWSRGCGELRFSSP